MYHWFLKTQNLYILRSGLESQTINSYYGVLLTSLPQDPTPPPLPRPKQVLLQWSRCHKRYPVLQNSSSKIKGNEGRVLTSSSLYLDRSSSSSSSSPSDSLSSTSFNIDAGPTAFPLYFFFLRPN